MHRPRFFLLAIAIAAVYALVAMLVGGMLVIVWPPAHLIPFWVILPTGTPWWNYPGFLAVDTWFLLSLPFLPTWFMVFTSAGVGLGMTVAVILAIGLVRQRRAAAARPAAVGGAAGLTPALIALVTLGACCSTTAAATAGIGIAAGATGTSAGLLLLNTWYLGVFQLAILYVALLAQEQLLTVYGSLVATAPALDSGTPTVPPLDRRFMAGAVLRVALLAAGITWSLAMVAEWLTVAPGSASASLWVDWMLQHQLVGLVAVVAALLPVQTYRAFARSLPTFSVQVLRVLLVIGGVSLAVGVPPPLAATGWHGFGNELLGVLGVSTTWGAVAAGVPFGLGLALRWLGQYLLLGGFGILLGLRPRLALRPILWTATGFRNPHSVPSPQVAAPGGLPNAPDRRIGVSAETDR